MTAVPPAPPPSPSYPWTLRPRVPAPVRRGAVVDVVIVGGGLAGVAAAHALALRGVTDVLVVERGGVGGPDPAAFATPGGLGGFGAVGTTVHCHHPLPALAALAWSGLRLLEDAPEALGSDPGFRRTGHVVGVGPERVRALAAEVAARHALGVDVELVRREDATALLPTADLRDVAAFAYEARGGSGDPARTRHAFARAAVRAGARIRQGVVAVALATNRGGDRVTGVRLADGQVVTAGTVLVAAGPDTAGLVGALGVRLPLRALREPVVAVDPATPLPTRVPTPVFSDLVTPQYVSADGPLLLVGRGPRGAGPAGEPPYGIGPEPAVERAGDAETERAVRRFAARFPGCPDAAFVASYAVRHHTTPDGVPAVGAAGPDGLFVAAGFGGHSLALPPAAGALVADLMCEGASTDPLVPASVFAPDRFTTTAPPDRTHREAEAREPARAAG
ncbi:NAD(P)/FAD-dependent oxidoreductase [Yinghuangia seranimata]|uniref:NAD(P)/FAD-dependent oxidoreductase n=1 Tax=Yinghuangia seranimata TaxID=408067 RepID=UPI00248C7CE7|nr:FAD-dependent oxidoreductase [Yinghuangia seranimata]MDI2126053.1 FAD-dependent oxidoreductase [Yinghuangia seranimata]